ncbi:MAG: FTR1 family protein [Rhodospirillaceae bacterium]|nr:FTR1 family protein [Rhodospirillaceae bacterium]
MRFLIAVFLLLVQLALPASVDAAPDYRGLVSRIDAMLADADKAYRAGDVEAAKTAVQRSYFEIFENLEGPIRVNVSARRSYQLEAEFGAIRKLMVEGVPADTITERIRRQIAALDEIVPALEKGFQLKAEKSEEAAPSEEPDQTAANGRIEPYWEKAVETILGDLNAAADALEKGDAAKAKDLVQKAQFAGYKNTLLETAVRRHVSQRQDVAFNTEFSRIIGLINDGRPAALIRGSARVLTDEITALLPGLPLVGIAKQEAEKVAETSVDWAGVATKINASVAESLKLAAQGNSAQAVSRLQDTYFDLFEGSGMEARIGARDTAFKTQIEAHFSKLMALTLSGAGADTLKAEAQALETDLAQAVTLLGGGGAGDALSLFGYALLIILREGFEAMLIVTAIVAYLVKTGHADKQRVIANSVFVALLASVATAILFKLVFRASAASQEVLEGGTMLLATVVLFFMSYWLISKAEAEKWAAYIEDKVQSSLTTGSIRVLWFTSFLAVYREGAETVLFYQALTIDAEGTGLLAIAAGFLVGCLGLGIGYWAMRTGALRLPIRPFFQATGALLYLMAFVFAGKGVVELIEGKIIQPSLIHGFPEIPFLGVYPYWESLLPQAALLAAALVALVLLLRKPRPEGAKEA